MRMTNKPEALGSSLIAHMRNFFHSGGSLGRSLCEAALDNCTLEISTHQKLAERSVCFYFISRNFLGHFPHMKREDSRDLRKSTRKMSEKQKYFASNEDDCQHIGQGLDYALLPDKQINVCKK